jgi:hypothetical protein
LGHIEQPVNRPWQIGMLKLWEVGGDPCTAY